MLFTFYFNCCLYFLILFFFCFAFRFFKDSKSLLAQDMQKYTAFLWQNITPLIHINYNSNNRKYKVFGLNKRINICKTSQELRCLKLFKTNKTYDVIVFTKLHDMALGLLSVTYMLKIYSLGFLIGCFIVKTKKKVFFFFITKSITMCVTLINMQIDMWNLCLFSHLNKSTNWHLITQKNVLHISLYSWRPIHTVWLQWVLN